MAQEDVKYRPVPQADDEDKVLKEMYTNGGWVCYCYECGRQYTGTEDTLICLQCLNEIGKICK